ncbi:hypothetical protein VP1G_01469 [Cytospora mali]|uniref:Late endosomal/lysosomal adaptor and MAPK and MTOR activator 1 n=1 Tax=Cytospora mali TaxID=578113 RepID=A0A194UR07_CYTMA|nr:hypothetical protein VP1G_01469 [Valsa mali var. pyri (nom. inval.)]
MGICASCLGSRRRDSVTEEDFAPTSPLLFSVPNGMHYGSFAEPQMAQQNDTSETQREIEALQRVVARTSDNMVDVFDTAPSKAPINPYGQANQEARQTWYHALLSRLSNEEDSASEDGEDEEDDPDLQRDLPRVKTDQSEALVGTFREAAAAMA